MHHRSHGLHCILPSNVLENIARKGNDEQRDWATRALSLDHSIRLARVQNSLTGLAAPGARAP
jgi:hypothetical protein